MVRYSKMSARQLSLINGIFSPSISMSQFWVKNWTPSVTGQFKSTKRSCPIKTASPTAEENSSSLKRSMLNAEVKSPRSEKEASAGAVFFDRKGFARNGDFSSVGASKSRGYLRLVIGCEEAQTVDVDVLAH